MSQHYEAHGRHISGGTLNVSEYPIADISPILPEDEAHRIARLFAAAPALLAACEAALDELVKLQDQRHHNTPDGLGVIISLRAAIAQARNV